MSGRLAPIVLALAAIPSAAPAAKPDADLAHLQQRDARLFETGWRLVTGNARYCAGAAPAIGLLLHDANAYAHPEDIRDSLGLSGDIGVEAVAPGSPADKSGLAVNDTLVGLSGRPLEGIYPPSDPRWQRLIDIDSGLGAALRAGPADLSWKTPGGTASSAEIEGVPACPSRFEVLDSGSRAIADGARVMFGVDFAAFGYADGEFAAAVAHELAHNLLHHRALLDREGRSRTLVRRTERDADRLMPWLLYNAGYDPDAALRFMQRWGPRHDGGLLRKRTHDGWDERAEFIAAEIARLHTAISEDGEADWSRRFVAEATGDARE